MVGFDTGVMSSGLQVYVDLAAEALRDGTDLYGRRLPTGGSGLADQGVIIAQLAEKMATDDPQAMGLVGVSAQAWHAHAQENARAVAVAAATDNALSVHLDASGQVVTDGAAAMAANNHAAEQNTAVIAPFTNSPAGDRQMLRELDTRLGTAKQTIAASDRASLRLARLIRAAGSGGATAPPALTQASPATAGSRFPPPTFATSGHTPIPNLTTLRKAFSPPGIGSTVGPGAPTTASGMLPHGVANENRLQRKTILAARAISAAFPEIRDIGGYRPDSLKWHPHGLAVDVMIPHPNTPDGHALGNRVLQFVLQNQQTFGLDHAIYRQTMYIPGQAPTVMENRGSPTQNHMDHVHVATSGGGYPGPGESYAM